MQLFNRNATPENRHETLGRWPARMRRFHLVTDFELTVREQPEVFVVSAGKAVLSTETGAGNQVIAPGTVMVSRSGSRENLVNVHALEMIGLRFLPEWFADASEVMLSSADSIALWARMFFFGAESAGAQPEVFHLDKEEQAAMTSDLTVITDALRAHPDAFPGALVRLTLQKIFMHLAAQHGKFWRGEQHLVWHREMPALLELFERAAARGTRMNLSQAANESGIASGRITSCFEEGIGIGPMDYLERRRAQYAARLMLTTHLADETIALRTGFSNLAGLEERMKIVFGRGSAQYRADFCK